MSAAGLTVRTLSVRYGERTALAEVSMQVGPGEVVALAGPNGSGKSSLLRAAVGLESAAAGAVELGDRPVRELSLRDRARRVAWMPQEEPPGDNLSVVEFVRYGRYPYQAPFVAESGADRAAVERALRLAGAEELRRRPVWNLSGGERQRARLARVLAQGAPILLLDEPTAHLDIGHQLDVLERIRSVARSERTAVVLALHDLNLAARFADRVVVLAHGRVAADGPPAQVLSSRLLLEVWGIDSELRYDRASRLPYLIPRPAPSPPTGEPATALPRVHVMAGGGSGGELVHRLVDAGYAVSVGALPLFDSDTAVAEELRLPCALEVPFAPISDATRVQLRALLSESAAVVVAPFPVGPANLANLEELRSVVPPESVHWMAQPVGRPWDYTGGTAESIRAELIARGSGEVADVEQLLERLRARVPRRGP
jgi:iron complex transport system ATP-binding protein